CAQLAGMPLPQGRPQVLQTSVYSQPPPAPAEGNGHGNGHGQIARSGAAPEGQFAAALLDLADHSPEAQRLAAEEKQEAVAELIQAYRIRGHLFANLDPLGLHQKPANELDLENFGLTEDDLDTNFATGDFHVGAQTLTLREIVARLRRTYCRTIGAEYMHGEDPRIRKWLQERMEEAGNEPRLDREEKLRMRARLTEAATPQTYP